MPRHLPDVYHSRQICCLVCGETFRMEDERGHARQVTNMSIDIDPHLWQHEDTGRRALGGNVRPRIQKKPNGPRRSPSCSQAVVRQLPHTLALTCLKRLCSSETISLREGPSFLLCHLRQHREWGSQDESFFKRSCWATVLQKLPMGGLVSL